MYLARSHEDYNNVSVVRTSASSQEGAAQTRFTLLSQTNKKPIKLYTTAVFRHWATGSTGQLLPTRKKTNKMNLMNQLTD